MIKVEQYEKAVALMKAGSTLGEAAERAKVSRGSLYKWMDQRGLERSRRTPQTGTRNTKYTERYQKLHDMILKGAPITQTAKDLGITLSSYYRWKGLQSPAGKVKKIRTRRTQDVTVHQMELATGPTTDRIVALVGTPAQIAQAIQQFL